MLEKYKWLVEKKLLTANIWPVATKDLDSVTNKFQIQHKIYFKKSTVALILSKIGTFLAIKNWGQFSHFLPI